MNVASRATARSTSTATTSSRPSTRATRTRTRASAAMARARARRARRGTIAWGETNDDSYDALDDDDDVIAVANDPSSSALDVLGFTRADVEGLTPELVRAAYRARAKACHPDRGANSNARSSATMRVRLAYERVMKTLRASRGDDDHASSSSSSIDDDDALDPFDAATLAKYFDGAERVFVNEFSCLGRACWSSCVEKGGGRFTYADDTGAARYVGDDGFGAIAANAEDAAYVAWIAAEQCPEKCIHFVTEAQRRALRGHTTRAIAASDARARDEAGALIQMLLAQAAYENGRAAGALNSRRERVATSKWVDWYDD